MKTDDERQQQLDKIYNKVELGETLKPDEYELLLKEQKDYTKELEDQSQTLANSLDIANETYNMLQEKFHALSEEYNKACQQRDTLIRVIDNLLK